MPFDKRAYRRQLMLGRPRDVVPCSLGCGNRTKYITSYDTFFFLNCSCRALVCPGCYSRLCNDFSMYTCIYCRSVGHLYLFRPCFNHPIPPRYLCWQQFLSRFQQFNPRISNWVIFRRMIDQCHHMLFDDEERNSFFEFFLRLQTPILRTHVAHRRKLSHLAITPQLRWTLLQLSWTRKLVCRMFEQPMMNYWLFYHVFLQTTGLSGLPLKAMHALLRRVMSRCGPKWKTML